MTGYEKLYYTLFNAITDALRKMEDGKMGEAAELLKAAQCRTEEMYVDEIR